MHYLSHYAATLLADYDDPQAFGHTLAVMADEAEERGDVWLAEALRWMVKGDELGTFRPWISSRRTTLAWWREGTNRTDEADRSNIPNEVFDLLSESWFRLYSESELSEQIFSAVLALAQAYAKVQAERERDRQRVEAHERAHYQGLER